MVSQKALRSDSTGRAVFQLIESLIKETIANTTYGKQLKQIFAASLGKGGGLTVIDRLPSICCEASGGNASQALPTTAAWQLLRLAAKLFDDIEDGEVERDRAEATNLATGILFVAQSALQRLPQKPSQVALESQYRIVNEFNRACLFACAGQHEDLASQVNFSLLDPDLWIKATRAKSGELLGWAAWAGAMVGGAQESVASTFREFGVHLGILLQISDDFCDFWSRDNPKDLRSGRITLPTNYMLVMSAGAERAQIIDLVQRSGLGDRDAQERLLRSSIELGAQKYALALAWIERQNAYNALKRACLNGNRALGLTALLNEVFPALPEIEKNDR